MNDDRVLLVGAPRDLSSGSRITAAVAQAAVLERQAAPLPTIHEASLNRRQRRSLAKDKKTKFSKRPPVKKTDDLLAKQIGSVVNGFAEIKVLLSGVAYGLNLLTRTLVVNDLITPEDVERMNKTIQGEMKEAAPPGGGAEARAWAESLPESEPDVSMDGYEPESHVTVKKGLQPGLSTRFHGPQSKGSVDASEMKEAV